MGATPTHLQALPLAPHSWAQAGANTPPDALLDQEVPLEDLAGLWGPLQ